MKLRYYADDFKQHRHDQKVNLLEQIEEQWSIPFEIKRVSINHGRLPVDADRIEESTEEEVWENELKNNRTLSNNLGPNTMPSDEFKTSNNFAIASTIAIVDGGVVQWGVRYSQGIEFLEEVLENGESAVGERYDNGDRSIHDRIKDEFVDQEVVGKGEYDTEVEIGASFANNPNLEEQAKKSIDVLVTTPASDWIVEIKPEFSASKFQRAVGQALMYESIYQKERSAEQIQKAVVLAGGGGEFSQLFRGGLRGQIHQVCADNDIAFFIRESDGEFSKLTSESYDPNANL